jgi:uncharacterized phage protein (TIGR01671 family)
MRELKFRAWDVINKKMYPIAYPTWNGMTEGKIDFLNHKVETIDTDGDNIPIVMQYTGLKDQNGVEIYKDDIVKRENFNAVVKEINGCWMFERKADYYVNAHWYMSDSEVIGNIHENPELIEA